MSIHLVQLLCPKRHCIFAVPYPSEQERGKERTIALMEEARTALGMNTWCGICGSRELTYDDGDTGFQTLEEAMPMLRALEEENFWSRQLLDQTGQSYDSQSRN